MQNWLQNKNQIDMADLLVILGFPVSPMSPMSLTFCPPTCPLILLVQGVKVSVSVSHVDFFLLVQWEGLAEPLTKDNNINSY